MANKVTSMQILRMIIQMLDRKTSERRISKQLNISRNTVKYYREQLHLSSRTYKELQSLDDAGLSAILYADSSSLQPEDERKDYFRSQVPYFLSELKDTGVTRQLLWEEYIQEQPDGYRYSQFCFHLNELSKVLKPSFHAKYNAAEVVMIDFAGSQMHFIDTSTGEEIGCPVLVCVLPFSNLTYVQALPDAKLPNLIAALNNCLRYFNGAPLSLKTDNMKQVVQKSNRYEPVFTELIQQWALHNNMDLVAARPRMPKDKAPVEGHVKIAYQRIYAPLRNKIYFSLEELNTAIGDQLELHNNKNFQGKNYSRRQQFTEQEQQLLQPLPDQPFVLKHTVSAKVQKNYHITLGEDWHHYSVPVQYIGKQVTVIYDTQVVEIFLDHHRIATHKRSFKKHDYTTVRQHMPQNHSSYAEQKGWNSDYFLNASSKVGPCTGSYVEGILKGRQFTEQTFNSCRGVLRLGNIYGNDRLESACQRALSSNTYSYKTLANILANNLDKAPDSLQTTLFQGPEHDNIRGAEAYQ